MSSEREARWKRLERDWAQLGEAAVQPFELSEASRQAIRVGLFRQAVVAVFAGPVVVAVVGGLALVTVSLVGMQNVSPADIALAAIVASVTVGIGIAIGALLMLNAVLIERSAERVSGRFSWFDPYLSGRSLKVMIWIGHTEIRSVDLLRIHASDRPEVGFADVTQDRRYLLALVSDSGEVKFHRRGYDALGEGPRPFYADSMTSGI